METPISRLCPRRIGRVGMRGYAPRLIGRSRLSKRSHRMQVTVEEHPEDALDTMSFQALDFYLKLGYTVFGRLDDLPEGHSRIFLKKALDCPAP
jgi:hypothetical protein